MTNIHILPTNKPSRFYYNNNDKQFQLCKIEKENTILKPNQNIYITNDEEIKEGDWFYDLHTNYVKVKQSWENSHLGFNSKKIVLTTNQDLIKDGVQKIYNEFLEWFVKNNSCKEVEIKYQTTGLKNGGWQYDYKISIPKEEPKEHIEFINKNIEAFDKAVNKSKLKQETLEEVAENYAISQGYSQKDYKDPNSLFNEISRAVRVGYKFQQERSYSKEDMILFSAWIIKRNIEELNDPTTLTSIRTSSNEDLLEEYFKQFKK